MQEKGSYRLLCPWIWSLYCKSTHKNTTNSFQRRLLTLIFYFLFLGHPEGMQASTWGLAKKKSVSVCLSWSKFEIGQLCWSCLALGFSWILQGVSKDFLQIFLRTFWRLSRDFQMTFLKIFEDLLRTYLYIDVYWRKYGPSEIIRVEFGFFKLNFCFMSLAFENL